MALLKKSQAKKKEANALASAKPKRGVKVPRFLAAIGGYFKGSWQELRQTTWPTRKATWVLTLAVAIFTIAMMVLIVALDYLFDLLFKRIVL